MAETMYRAEVLCQECGETYLSRAKEEKSLPSRCKYCGSSRLAVDPDSKHGFYEVRV